VPAAGERGVLRVATRQSVCVRVMRLNVRNVHYAHERGERGYVLLIRGYIAAAACVAMLRLCSSDADRFCHDAYVIIRMPAR